MNAKESFALAVRIIAMLGLMYIVRAFIRNPTPSTLLLVERIVCVFVGLYLLRGAPLLVNFAYPDSAETTEKSGK